MNEDIQNIVPRRLRIKAAIHYLGGGMSEATFMKIVAPYVPTIILSPRNRGWLREDLDSFLMLRAGKTEVDSASESPKKLLDRILSS